MDAKVNGERLWAAIMETAAIGRTPNGGITRLTLTDLDRQVRDWLHAACEAAECRVIVDDMGNMFARREGRRHEAAPIAIGSHLDTQPRGGKFDGVLGVLAALEVVRTLNDNRTETDHPIEVVNWTNEEGARFAPAMLASGVFAGVFSKAYAYARTDADGRRLEDELERIGYRGEEPCGEHKIAGYLELHIEQGPVLEAAGRDIGVVTGVQGMRWFDLDLEGFAGHAGTTPMALRRDAMVGAARVIEAVREIALEAGDQAVGTTGVIRAEPESRNVVAGGAHLTIDLRHPDAEVLERMEVRLRERIDSIARDLGLEQDLKQIWESAPMAFDPRCVDSVRRAAEANGFTFREMTSGAGHDAVYASRVAPTGMIFVPCEKGVSHNEAENITPENAVAGAQTLLDAALLLDDVLD